MKTIILHVLCEGQTEDAFVSKVLKPYLLQFDIHAKSEILITSKKKNVRGGMLSYVTQAKRDLRNMMLQYKDNDYEHHVFTTMFDYYALPDDFPAFREAHKCHDVRKRIKFIEDAFCKDIASSSFIPYIQLHEFEALLYVDIERLKADYPDSSKEIDKLKIDSDKIGDPELINNKPETAPSKRIIKALQGKYHYNKVLSGADITKQIGLERLMDKCTHFREWLEKIISLSRCASICD